MATLLHDVRYATRLLLRTPTVTLVAVLSLGLGIGANSTIFSLVDAVLLAPLPMREPARLVAVFTADERNRQTPIGAFAPLSRPNAVDYRDRNEVFEGLAYYAGTNLSLSGGTGEPEQVFAEIASPEYFDVVGAPLAAGRAWSAAEASTDGAAPITVLSHGLWQRRFGADPGLVGRTITLNGRAFTVVGVASEAFKGANAIAGPQLWVPSAMWREVTAGFVRDSWESRRALFVTGLGRLKPGVTVAQAGANLAQIASALASEFPNENRGRGATVVPLAEATINPGFRGNVVTAGALLMVVVGLVLLIACANVANLLLARAAARRQEIAVRVSLGAGRGRLVRQLLTESTLLGLLGGAAGLLFATWAQRALVAMRPPFLPADALALGIDGRVVTVTAVVALGTGLLFGLAPALQSSRPDLATELKDRSALPSGGGRRALLRHGLVVGQLALSFVALIGAGLFLRSLDQARTIDPGFDVDRLAVLSFSLAAQGLPPDAAEGRRREILARVAALPGVERVAYATTVPLAGGTLLRSVFLEGQDMTDQRSGRLVSVTGVGEGYFEAAGIRLLRGRDLRDTDVAGGPSVVVINETMAARFWPGEEPLGKRFRFFNQPALTEVVGVVRDSKYNFLGEAPQPYMYQPLGQGPAPAVTLFVKAAAPEAALGTARAVVQQMEPTMPLTGVFTMRQVFGQALWPARMGALLLGVFAGLALVLATIGVYGVMAYAVSQRTRELGIRLALGATRGEVRRLVFKQGLGLTLLGVAIGLAVAAAAVQSVATLLYGVAAWDPLTFAVIPLLLTGVASLAIYLPARRAAQVDPIVALRG